MEVGDVGEAEAGGVESEALDRPTGLGAGGGGPGAGAVEADQVKAFKVREVLAGELDEGENVVNALGEEGIVVAEGVSGRLARIGDLAGLSEGLRVGEEFTLVQQVGAEDSDARAKEFFDGWGGTGRVLRVGEECVFAGPVQPDDGMRAGWFGFEDDEREFFAVGEVAKEREVLGVIAAVGAAVGGTGNGAGACKVASEDDVEGAAVAVAEFGKGVLGQGEEALVAVVDGPEEMTFEVGAGIGFGMLVVPNGQLVGTKEGEVSFFDGFGGAEAEVAVEPPVHGGAAWGVVVMPKLEERFEHDVVPGAEHGEVLLELREPFHRHFLGPIVGGGHAKRFGGEEGRDFDVAGVHAKK